MTMNYPCVTPQCLKEAYECSMKAKISFTHYKKTTTSRGREEIRHIPKVCCVCDRFIKFDCEAFINIQDFREKFECYFEQNKIEDPYNLSDAAKRKLNEYYTQHHFVDDEDEWLDHMILSPRSYGSETQKGKKKLGCCTECKNALKNMSRRKEKEKHPCRFAIANGLMIGTAPDEIEALNDVELALMSKGRCEKHIFSYRINNHFYS